MRVLVLGATGKLGRMIKWAWVEAPDLRRVWHQRHGTPDGNGVSFELLPKARELAAICDQFDVVVNLAGIVPSRPEDLSLNRDLAVAVQNALGDTPHLLASSAAVYGRAGGLCRETDAPHPVAPYGQAKLEMEEAVLAMGGRVTCLRIGNVAGADQILGAARKGQILSLDQFEDGRTPRRSYIGPSTLGRVLGDLIRAAGQGMALPDVMNIATPGTVEMGALLDAAEHPWTPRPAPEAAIGEVALDITRLSRFTALDPEAGTAPALVAEWRAYEQATRSSP